MGRGISVPAVAIAGAGGVAVWAAVKGVGAGSGFRAILAGRTLPPGEDLTVTVAEQTGSAIADTGAPGVGTAAGVAASNNAISNAGMRYVGQGHVYRWGGGSPAGWDCSGFSNWVICHDLGLAIPGYAGGTFTGGAHGPVTMQWAGWSGCQTIPRDQVQAGDLVVWPLFHMGIAISNSHMVNAPGPNGTPAPVVGTIDGAARGPLVCRRLIGRR
jgi:peptidoglycan DL-endopeptidase CwlO